VHDAALGAEAVQLFAVEDDRLVADGAAGFMEIAQIFAVMDQVVLMRFARPGRLAYVMAPWTSFLPAP